MFRLFSFCLLALCSTVSMAQALVVSTHPIYLIAQKVTQNIETPTLLLADQTGHDVSLTPAHRKIIQDADLIIWLGKAHEAPLERVLHQNPTYCTKAYHEIKSVEISVKHRYMKPIGYATYAPAIQAKTADFTFTFEDDTTLFLLAPMILANDAEFIAVILRSKVKSLHDPNNFLDSKKDHYA